jgi:anti-sigma factor RsiW
MNATKTPSVGLPRDRFELLSAYLDGELTATERQQVEGWLESDPHIQDLYKRLLSLRHSFRTWEAPTMLQPPEQFAQTVLEQLDQRRQRWLWRVGPIAAALVGAWVGLSLGQSRLSPQFAKTPTEPTQVAAPPVKIATEPSDTLSIALDQPIIAFPEEDELGHGAKPSQGSR